MKIPTRLYNKDGFNFKKIGVSLSNGGKPWDIYVKKIIKIWTYYPL